MKLGTTGQNISKEDFRHKIKEYYGLFIDKALSEGSESPRWDAFYNLMRWRDMLLQTKYKFLNPAAIPEAVPFVMHEDGLELACKYFMHQADITALTTEELKNLSSELNFILCCKRDPEQQNCYEGLLKLFSSSKDKIFWTKLIENQTLEKLESESKSITDRMEQGKT